jgi:tetratricopeptide (TPR) repeat protein
VEVLEPLCRRHPDVALGAWQLGLALYDAAIEDVDRSRDPRAKLSASEAAFVRCRGMDARMEAGCRALEAQCRGALGYWMLGRADLEGAHKTFLSMQDAVKGGLALEIRGARLRGTDGLFRVAEGYGERGDPGNPGSIDSLEQAARICNLLHELDPGDARFAAASGRFNRDAAVALELEASSLADRGKLGEAERMLGRARELMETAFSAWRDAAALAPDEERPAAQAGAVLARYLQRDADRARSFLEKAVELGENKVQELLAAAGEKGISEPERQARRKRLEDEETLVGDACKDLGLVHLELLGDPSKAREWLERGRKAGPDPRPEIDGLLERCQKALAGEVAPRLRDEDRWAPPGRPERKP